MDLEMDWKCASHVFLSGAILKGEKSSFFFFERPFEDVSSNWRA